jgi:hypothetical protein
MLSVAEFAHIIGEGISTLAPTFRDTIRASSRKSVSPRPTLEIPELYLDNRLTVVLRDHRGKHSRLCN